MQLSYIFALLACLVALCRAQVIQVTDSNVKSLITDDSEWLLEFYADWCGYCRKYLTTYEAAEDALSLTTTVRVGQVNVETSPGLAARFFVQRLPTLVHIKNHEVRVIPFDRMNDLVNFVKDEAWQEIQPVNGLTSPFSYVGSLVDITGRMVKWGSSVSPVTLVLLMLTLVILVAVKPMLLNKEEDETKAQDVKEKEPSTTGETTATMTSPSTKQRKSKRID